jgi:hypothetical protein
METFSQNCVEIVEDFGRPLLCPYPVREALRWTGPCFAPFLPTALERTAAVAGCCRLPRTPTAARHQRPRDPTLTFQKKRAQATLVPDVGV